MLTYLLKCTALGAIAGAGISLARNEIEKDPRDRNITKLVGGAVIAASGFITAGIVIANKYNEHSE